MSDFNDIFNQFFGINSVFNTSGHSQVSNVDMSGHSQVSINGVNISVQGTRIFVHGKEYVPKGDTSTPSEPSENTMEDTPDGDGKVVLNLTQDMVVEAVEGNLYVRGNNVKLEVRGDVGGNVDTAGSATIGGHVGKKVDAGGSVTVSGSVKGRVDAGGSVRAGSIQGRVDAGGSVIGVRK